jgi:cyclopropane fatty-acyl-phospholipid synthase-like methyltransferase
MENKICQHEKYEIISEMKDVKIGKCQDCELIFAIKANQIDANKIYQDFYTQEMASRFNFWMEFIIKIFRFWRAVKIIRLKSGAKSILDIGSGRGWMLYFLQKYFNYETTIGTQISQPAYEFSRDKLKLEIYNKDLLDIKWDKSFDIVTLWHIFEHVKSPEAYLQKIQELLKEGGLLIIEVPNYNSWTSVLTKNHWLALDLKHHLTFFTPATLVQLLNKYNFKVRNLNTFSLEYSAFTSTQSLVNFLTQTDNYFFRWLQKGGFNLKIILHSGLFAVLLPICLVINLILYFSSRGEVINIVAQKNNE